MHTPSTFLKILWLLLSTRRPFNNYNSVPQIWNFVSEQGSQLQGFEAAFTLQGMGKYLHCRPSSKISDLDDSRLGGGGAQGWEEPALSSELNAAGKHDVEAKA